MQTALQDSSDTVEPQLTQRSRRRVRTLDDNEGPPDPPTRRRRLRDLPIRRAAASREVETEAALHDGSTPAARTSPSVSPAPTDSQPHLCPICLINPSNTALIPCGHCTCSTCYGALMNIVGVTNSRCPVCRASITSVVQLHFAL